MGFNRLFAGAQNFLTMPAIMAFCLDEVSLSLTENSVLEQSQ